MRVLLRLAAVLAVGAFFLLALVPSHTVAGASTSHAVEATPHDTTGCPPEANSCDSDITFPVGTPSDCAASPCTVTAGPVSELGQGQAVYVDLHGLASGVQVALALCTLTTGTAPVTEPQCASSLPPPSNCQEQGDCTPASSPLEWQYATSSGSDTVLSIGTEYDPNIPDAQAISSQTSSQYGSQTDPYGSFFCDNGPANPCGIEVMDLGVDSGNVIADGYPPRVAFTSSSSNTVIVPLNWAASGSGCQSAPIMEVDASYSVAQFLPAAGSATCNSTGGVAVLPTDMPSVDDSTCATTGLTHCPIEDVINGTVPASFTDDPDDPATLAELKAAGGTFAYIPIAVSATEIAFEGQAGLTGGAAATYPLSSYDLTPAMAAGIMTQLWTSPVAAFGQPQDDLCSELTTTPECTETALHDNNTVEIYNVNGDYANLDVSTEDGGTPESKTFPFLGYTGDYNNISYTNQEKNFQDQTGFALLNPWPFNSGGSPATESSLDAMFPSTGSGASYETTSWICASPEPKYSVSLPWGGTAMLADLESGQQILANGEQDPIEMTPNGDGGYTENATVAETIQADPNGCTPVSTLPTDFAATTSAGGATSPYSPSSEPLTAAHAIQGVVSKGLLGFAFSAMDSSEADFFGLLPANLENASGDFVAPSTTAIQNAINDEAQDPNGNGTLLPNYATTDATAYPMPQITYALISTKPQPTAAGATQLSDMLTNLVTYSHEGGTSGEPLPPGYVALPQSLETEALGEIAKDVIAPDGQPVTPGSTSPGSSGSSSSSTSGSSTTPGAARGASGSFGGASGTAFRFGGHGSTTQGPPTATGNSGSGSSITSNPIGRLITVTLGDNRFLVPALLLLALLCLILGPLLYVYPSLRKPSAAAAGGPDAADGGGGGPPPDAAS